MMNQLNFRELLVYLVLSFVIYQTFVRQYVEPFSEIFGNKQKFMVTQINSKPEKIVKSCTWLEGRYVLDYKMWQKDNYLYQNDCKGNDKGGRTVMTVEQGPNCWVWVTLDGIKYSGEVAKNQIYIFNNYDHVAGKMEKEYVFTFRNDGSVTGKGDWKYTSRRDVCQGYESYSGQLLRDFRY